MSIDSTSELLFSIGAETDDAEGNIQRFRALLGKDLDDLSAEFGEWSTKVFGDLTTVEGALTATAAAGAAAVVAIGAALVEAAHKYAEYVEQVEHASRVTGIDIEEMSKLSFAAQKMGVSHEQLTHMLVFFESQIDKANGSADVYAKTFGRLGISQEVVRKGETDVLAALMPTMAAMHDLKEGTEGAAIARGLFSRSGAEGLPFLKLDAEAMNTLADEAKRLHKYLTKEDADAYVLNKAAMQEFSDTMHGFAIVIGREVLPYLTHLIAMVLAMPEAVRRTKAELEDMSGVASKSAGIFETAGVMLGFYLKKLEPESVRLATGAMTALGKSIKDSIPPGGIIDNWKAATEEIEKHIKALGKLMAAGDDATKHLGDAPGEEKAKKTIYWIDLQTQGLKLLMDAWEKARQAQAAWGKSADEGQEIGFKIDQDAVKKQATEAASTVQTIMAMAWTGIDFKADEALRRELLSLQEHLGKVLEANMTASEKLAQIYQNDVAKYAAAEEAKAAAAARASGQEAQVHQQFAAIRTALLDRYNTDLQKLENSTGWQGVFGAKFGELLQGDEQKFKQWQESNNQSSLLMQDSFEMLGEMGQKAFEELAQGEGQAIANAIVYGKSVTDAMEKALKSTLASVSGQAMVMSLMALGWGFYNLAMGNAQWASEDFSAAAFWGAVGGAAAVAGRFMPGGSSGAGAGSGPGGSAAAGATTSASNPNASVPYQQGGPNVTVNVMGHIYGSGGIDELAQAINDAVLNRDVQLYSTATTTGQQLVKG